MHSVGGTVKEGLAEILIASDADHAQPDIEAKSKPQSVFYNPIQQYNRDLSVLAIRAFAEDFYYEERSKSLIRSQRNEGPRTKKRKRKPYTDDRDDVIDDDEVEANKVELDEGVTAPKDTGRAPEGHQDLDANSFTPKLRILDALSATGLRALRYGKELPLNCAITANDLLPTAAESIRANVEHNELQDKIEVVTSDAKVSMLRPHNKGHQRLPYHVIDLDPYGTAVPFMDAAISSVANGGLLCVTCTDAGVFASVGYLEKTYSLYGGLPLKGPHAHEGGLRLILHSIATTAARYGMSIEPLLSLSIDFYARVFVRIRKAPAEVKFLASKTMLVNSCDGGCGAWSHQFLAHARRKEGAGGNIFYKHTAAQAPIARPECEHCGFKTHLAGPMWAGPLHNPDFISRILEYLPTLDSEIYATIPRMEGMLLTALHENLELSQTSGTEGLHSENVTKDSSPVNTELTTSKDEMHGQDERRAHAIPGRRPVPPVDAALRMNHPFFIVPSALSRVLRCETPSDAAFRGALIHNGYRTSRSHTKPGSIVTDAPWTAVWEIMREWVRKSDNGSTKSYPEGTPGRGVTDKQQKQDTLRQIRQELVEALSLQNHKALKSKLELLLSKLDTEMAPSHAAGTVEQSIDGPVEAPCPTWTMPKDLGSHNGDGAGAAKDAKEEPLSKKRQIVFDEKLGEKSDKARRGRKLVRYQQNPAPNWGPKTKASGEGAFGLVGRRDKYAS